MVTFYRPNNKKNAKDSSQRHKTLASVRMERWDSQGKAIVEAHQPVTFVEGALPGERCDIKIVASHKTHWSATVATIIEPHPARRTPFCPVYAQCGGCQLQHVAPVDALQWRQEALDSQLQRSLNMSVLPWQPAISDAPLGYRRSARLAIDARQPNTIKLGFRRQQDNTIVDIDSCPILAPQLSALIVPLKHLLANMQGVKHIGHVQLVGGDNVAQVNVHITGPLPPQSMSAWAAFGAQHCVNVGITSAHAAPSVLHQQAVLQCVTEGELHLTPQPGDFVQVNAKVNQQMVQQAMHWLSPESQDTVLDLFAGVGNFSLSLAKRCAQVCAVEGVAEMVQAARENAQRQGIDNIEWRCADLSNAAEIDSLLSQPVTKVLLDPSREGAYALCNALAQSKVESILYVSCNPATFARDAQRLVSGRFELAQIGLIEMFPFTRHLEMMALFVPRAKRRGR